MPQISSHTDAFSSLQELVRGRTRLLAHFADFARYVKDEYARSELKAFKLQDIT